MLCVSRGAAEHAHLSTQVREAHMPVGFSSLASFASQGEAPCHQRQGPSVAPNQSLQHAADIGSCVWGGLTRNVLCGRPFEKALSVPQ